MRMEVLCIRGIFFIYEKVVSTFTLSRQNPTGCYLWLEKSKIKSLRYTYSVTKSRWIRHKEATDFPRPSLISALKWEKYLHIGLRRAPPGRESWLDRASLRDRTGRKIGREWKSGRSAWGVRRVENRLAVSREGSTLIIVIQTICKHG